MALPAIRPIAVQAAISPAIVPTSAAEAGAPPPPPPAQQVDEPAIMQDWWRYLELVGKQEKVAYGLEEIDEAYRQGAIAVLFLAAAALAEKVDPAVQAAPLPQIAMQVVNSGGRSHVVLLDKPLHADLQRWGGVAAILKQDLVCVRHATQFQALAGSTTGQISFNGHVAKAPPVSGPSGAVAKGAHAKRPPMPCDAAMPASGTTAAGINWNLLHTVQGH